VCTVSYCFSRGDDARADSTAKATADVNGKDRIQRASRKKTKETAGPSSAKGDLARDDNVKDEGNEP
jgi:hypothetical protein